MFHGQHNIWAYAASADLLRPWDGRNSLVVAATITMCKFPSKLKPYSSILENAQKCTRMTPRCCPVGPAVSPISSRGQPDFVPRSARFHPAVGPNSCLGQPDCILTERRTDRRIDRPTDRRNGRPTDRRNDRHADLEASLQNSKIAHPRDF